MSQVERHVTDGVFRKGGQWQQIQKNTFTRWCNEQLKYVNQSLQDLETDLSDGSRLRYLVEVLSQKRINGQNRKPVLRQMKLDNVCMVLQFIEREGVHLVNIDSQVIVDGNLKLTLGLIWSLICHYSISSIPVTVDQEARGKATPKARLLGWIREKVPVKSVSNFSKDWIDGCALGALVDSYSPGLCPGWESWKPDKALENTGKAIRIADDRLSVPAIITPEELTNPNVDEQSVMTYLSQFCKAKLKPESDKTGLYRKDTIDDDVLPPPPPDEEFRDLIKGNFLPPPPPDEELKGIAGEVDILAPPPNPAYNVTVNVLHQNFSSSPSIEKTQEPPKVTEVKAISSNQTTITPSGTIKRHDGFDPTDDAAVLRKLMKGIGSNAKPLIQMLSKRTNDQRQEIMRCYKKLGGDLMSDIKRGLKGNILILVKALMTDPVAYDVKCLDKAMGIIMTDRPTLIEILSTRQNERIRQIKNTKGDHMQKLKSKTSEGIRQLLLTLAKGAREEKMTVDEDLATADAMSFLDAERNGDEMEFIDILTSRSFPQLDLTFQKYYELSGQDLSVTVRKVFPVGLQQGLIALIDVSRNIFQFFADKIKDALGKDLSHDVDTLIRIIVTRSEVDLEQIKEEFQKLTGESLSHWISTKIWLEDDYKELLMAIVEN